MNTSSGLALWPTENKAVHRKKYGICSVTGGTEIAKTISDFWKRNQSLYSISGTNEDKILISLIHIFANVVSSPSQCLATAKTDAAPKFFIYIYLIALLRHTDS